MKTNTTVFVLFFALNLFGQESDIGLWGGINFDKKLSSKFEVNGSGQIRFNNNIGEINGYYFSAGLKYKAIKWLNLVGELRFSDKKNNEWRLSAGFNLKHKISSLSLSLRQLFQKDFEMWSGDVKDNIHYQLRSRVEVSHALSKKIDLFISGEPFFLVDTGLYRWRYIIGSKIELTKFLKTEVGFIYQRDLDDNGELEQIRYVPTIDFNFNF